MKLIVDADATPRNALAICRQAAGEFGLELVTVANFNHNMESEHHLVVGDDPQAADMKVVNLTARGDIVVTQDWGLAAMVLGKGARAISPVGRIYRQQTIEFLLDSRHQAARVRRGGGRTRGPKKRTADDDLRFRQNLYRLIREDGGREL
jgi:uncharacterized protein YaiI (UPF0178 family)